MQQIEQSIRAVLDNGVSYHSLRTRKSGSRRFVELHVTVPGDMSVTEGHDFCERIEAAVGNSLPKTSVSTHLEPSEEAGEDSNPEN